MRRTLTVLTIAVSATATVVDGIHKAIQGDLGVVVWETGIWRVGDFDLVWR